MFKAILKYLEKVDSERYLEGKTVILRPWEKTDTRNMLNWYNDKELNRLAGWDNDVTTPVRIRSNMKNSFDCDPLNLMIEIKNGKTIGCIQLFDINQIDNYCYLGIRIGDRDSWGKGYAVDAINTIVDYAYKDLRLNRVALKVYEYNKRAFHCYLKCGFQQEGITRKSAVVDKEYYDEILMARLKP